MLAEDRKRTGWSVEKAARRLGVNQAIYREIEAETRVPAWENVGRSAGRGRPLVGFKSASSAGRHATMGSASRAERPT